METQVKSRFDWFKWLVVAMLMSVGLIANHYYASALWVIRVLIGLMLLGFVFFISSQTMQGKKIIAFIRESRTELRKVFWPTRQETIQTTIFVAVMVIVLAVILWGMDSLLMWLVGWLTGQRG